MPSLTKAPVKGQETTPQIVIATIGLMEELIRILDAEIDIVSRRRLKEHGLLLKTKQKLAMAYRANMKALAAQPDLLRHLPGEVKAMLRDTAQKLAAAADVNARALRAAVDAAQQLIQSVVSMVRSEALPKGAYKNAARAHLELGTYSPVCQPVAVRRSV